MIQPSTSACETVRVALRDPWMEKLCQQRYDTRKKYGRRTEDRETALYNFSQHDITRDFQLANS